MNLNPLKWLRREEKASAAGALIAMPHVGRPVWTDHDYAKLSKEAYTLNAISFACTKLIATSAARLPLLLMRGEDEVTDSGILDLLATPNPTSAGMAFLEAVYSYLMLNGNSYIEAVGPSRRNAPPNELWALRPDRMQVIPGPNGVPQAYVYNVNGREKRFQVDPITGRGDVLHIKEFHPIDDWYGHARVQPAAYGIDRHNAAGAHNTALLQNGARPSGALTFDPIKSDGNDRLAPSEVVQAAQERLLDGYSGPANAGKPMVFGASVKWVEMGLSPKDMDFAESKLDAARDICAAFGVPIELLLPGQSTYNNKAEANLNFYEHTVLPVASHVLSELNAWLLPRFGEGTELVVDEDSISALEPRREDRRKSTVELLDRGVIDVDEARERLQYGPRPSAAVVKADAGLITALVAAIPEAGRDPLVRYLKSVGLYDPTKTPEQIADDILDLFREEDEAEYIVEGADNAPDEGNTPGA